MASGERNKGGRPPGFTMSEAHRGKLRLSSILNALIEFAEGRRNMSATRVRVALALLDKALPDLPRVKVKADYPNPLQHLHAARLRVHTAETDQPDQAIFEFTLAESNEH